jgi:hypothetical protein
MLGLAERAAAAAIEGTRVGGVMEAMMGAGVGSLMEQMTERSKVFSQGIQALVGVNRNPFTGMIEQYRERNFGLPEIGSAFAGLDVGRYGEALGGLGLDPLIGSEFQSVAQRLSTQMAGMFADQMPKLDLGLSTNIEDLLARSLEAQEAFLEEQRTYHAEQREAGLDAKIEARFVRRNAYFNSLIIVLTFCWSIVVHFEGRMAEGEQAEADRAALIQMREDFEDMSFQLEELQQADEEREDAEAEREAIADAELAAIMREIAGSLRGQAEDGPDKETME